MDNNEMEYKIWRIVFTTIAVLGVTLIVSLVLRNTLITRAALENGYSEQSLPGQAGVYWVKNGKVLEETK